ncbi:MAG: hypothetical protein JKX84_04100 [Flavobacteriales bacterium]|nr:hypothetical protein [Flavobacteriales bacterium]
MLLFSLPNGTGFKKYELFTSIFSVLAFAGLCVAWFERNKLPLWEIKNLAWKMIAIVLCIGISVGFSLLLRKPYLEDYQTHTPSTFITGETETVGMMKELLGENNPILNNARFALSFFTPSCPHCERVATFIEATNRGGNFLPICAVIGGNENKISAFLESTGYTGSYVGTTNDSLFFSIVKGSVPKVYLIENESIKGIWDGMSFNYPAMDGLRKAP